MEQDRQPGVRNGTRASETVSESSERAAEASERASETSERAAEATKAVQQSSRRMTSSTAEMKGSADRRTEFAANRTVLAAERTYAAWIRTGLAALASGVGAQALLADVMPGWMTIATGSLLVLFSAFCFLIAVWRELFPSVDEPTPEVRRLPPALLLLANGFLTLVALVALVGIWIAGTSVN